MVDQLLPSELCLSIARQVDCVLRQQLHQELLSLIPLADPDSEFLGWLKYSNKPYNKWSRFAYSLYDRVLIRKVGWGRWSEHMIHIGITRSYTTYVPLTPWFKRLKNSFFTFEVGPVRLIQNSNSSPSEESEVFKSGGSLSLRASLPLSKQGVRPHRGGGSTTTTPPYVSLTREKRREMATRQRDRGVRKYLVFVLLMKFLYTSTLAFSALKK